jgi:hypothetical protein
MSFCPGCEGPQQLSNAQRATALKKAVQYAQSKQVPVSIYQDPATREFLFVETQYSAGLPILQNISPDFRLPA